MTEQIEIKFLRYTNSVLASINRTKYYKINQHYALVHHYDEKMYVNIFTRKPFDMHYKISEIGINPKSTGCQYLQSQIYIVNPLIVKLEKRIEAENYYECHKLELKKILCYFNYSKAIDLTLYALMEHGI